MAISVGGQAIPSPTLIAKPGSPSNAAQYPLLCDLQYMEPYATQGLNRKMRNIVLPGIYNGFKVSPGTGLTVNVSSTGDSGGGASINIGTHWQVSINQLFDVSVPVKQGQWIVALKATYDPLNGVMTRQVNLNSTIEAAEFVVISVSSGLQANMIEICRVNIPQVTQITDPMIDRTHRVERRIGLQLTDSINQNSSDIAASALAVKKTWDEGQAIKAAALMRGEASIGVSTVKQLDMAFNWQEHNFVGGEYALIDWSTSLSTTNAALAKYPSRPDSPIPDIDYPSGRYQVHVIGLSDSNNQTLLIRPLDYTRPLAPFMISWTGAERARVFRTRALVTAFGDINLLGGVGPNDLILTSHAGEYAQPSSAQALVAKGYPVNEAGNLKVTTSAYSVQQTYTTYSTCRTFNRGRTQAGAWGNWNETLTRVNLTANSTDLTAGKVLQVGDFGLGNSIPLTSPTTDFNAFINTADYNICIPNATLKNTPPGFNGFGTLSVVGRGAGTTTYVTQTLTDKTTKTQWRRTRDDTGLVWAEWVKNMTSSDCVTSNFDATVGRLMRVGSFGIGTYGSSAALTAAQARAPLYNGMYNVSAEPTYGNAGLISFSFDAGAQVHLIAGMGGQTPRFAICGSTPAGAFGGWGKIYTSFEKPTAADVQALSLGGGTITGALKIKVPNGNSAIRMYQDATANEYGVFLHKSGPAQFGIYATAKGAAESGGATSLKPLEIHLDSGRVSMGHGMDVVGQSSVSGGLISYGTANPLKLASGTGANDYSAIFRVSEDSLHIIPTVKGAALNSDIGPLRPLSISLASGVVTMKHGLTSTGPTILSGGLSVASGIPTVMGANSIALGDNDTGFKWNSDGNFDVMANSKVAMNITPYVINPKLEIQLETGSSSWISGRSQLGVISNRNVVSDASFQTMIRQNHSDRKFVIGGLGKTSFGIYMYLNSRKDADNAYDGGAWMAADGSWNCWGLSSTKEITAGGKISTSNIIQSTSTTNGAISWGTLGAGTSNNGDIFGTVWNGTGFGGTGVAATGIWLSTALSRAFAKAAACYTKAESDGRYPTKDSVSVIGFVSNNAANPYMRHATSNTAISLATASALNTVSGVANAAKTAAAGAQTTANTGVANAKTAQTTADGIKNTAVTGVRLGAQAGSPSAASGSIQAPAGCVITHVGDFGSDNAWGSHKPVQQCIKGAWATIGG